MQKYLQFAHPMDATSADEDLCVVLDRSGTMSLDDFKPDRLAGAKQAFCELLSVKRQHHPDDRVGVVAFDSSAEIVCPLTTIQSGYRWLEDHVNGLQTQGCTNITAGLKKAELVLTNESSPVTSGMRKAFEWVSRVLVESDPPSPTPTTNRTRRILLLGDGDHNTGTGPESVADRLKKNGVVIDVIGISGDRTTSDGFDEVQLKRIATRRPDGQVRYCFITDTAGLIKAFGTLAHHIRPLAPRA